MHYPDLSPYYDKEGSNIYNIGWLHPGKNYTTGAVDDALIAKLIRIGRREKVFLMRGLSSCYLIPCDGRQVQTNVDNINSVSVDKVLHSFEIWVPNIDRSKIFVAPSEIIHYIAVHNYTPPVEFVAAVMAFDLNTDWSGTDLRTEFINNIYLKR